MKFTYRTLVLLFGLIAIAPAAFTAAGLTPSQKFNSGVLKKDAGRSKSIEAELIQNANPHVKPFGAVIQASKWVPSSVFVCWENGSAADQAAMKWTEDAAQGSWAKYSSVKFVGWQTCAQANAGIRIRIEDSGPHVKQIGQFLDKVPNGMVLNFTFKNWSPVCQKDLEKCIRAIAVHEFGHAIGFTHEQNRPDTPGECMAAQGSNPDKLLTAYDPSSIMNYCNSKWNNDGVLSKLDIEAVRIVYGVQ